jgi:hypothetical protein
MGGFYCCCGGDLATSKRILMECCAEYDDAVTRGQSAGLHRVAHRLLEPSTSTRTALDAFLHSGLRLEDFPMIYMGLFEYALVPLVERQVEMIHSIINRVGKGCTHIAVPYVNAKVKESRNLQILRENRGFSDFCVAQWKSTAVLNNLLSHSHSSVSLKSMTVTAKTQAVFQGELCAEFDSMTEQRTGHAEWLALTSHLRPGVEQLQVAEKLCIAFLKERFQEQCYCSLPRDLFDKCVADGVGARTTNPIEEFMSALRKPNADFDFSAIERTVFFQVINSRPERSWTVRVSTDMKTSTSISISMCSVLEVSLDRKALIIYSDHSETSNLELRALVSEMGRAVESAFLWHSVGAAPILKELRQPKAQADFCEEYYVPPEVGSARTLRNTVQASSASSSRDIVPAETHDIVTSIGPLNRLFQEGAIHGESQAQGLIFFSFGRCSL